MPHYTLISCEDPDITVEFDGLDASSALSEAAKYELAEAELWCDGLLVCTIRQAPVEPGGAWYIVPPRTDSPLT